MKVISYNLRKHRAARELHALAERHEADVLCLQECDVTELPESVGDLTLAAVTHGNRLGLAMYYRSNTFELGESRAFGLKKSLHDRVLKPAHERLLGIRLRDIDHGSDVVIASFHAAPLTALNSLRRNQIRAALTELDSLGRDLPILMVGDYNYPVFKEHLSEAIRDHGFTLTLSDDRTYRRYKFFQGHYDFATSSGFDIEHIQTLPQASSDHRPILITAAPRPAFGQSASIA